MLPFKPHFPSPLKRVLITAIVIAGVRTTTKTGVAFIQIARSLLVEYSMRSMFARTLSCALLSLFPLSAAHAIDQDIALTATVEPSCTLSGSAAPSALTTTVPVTNGQVSTTPITVSIPIACNGAAALLVGTLNGGMRKSGGSFPNFANRIDYVAHVAGPGYIPFSLDTEQTSGQTFTEDYAPSGPPNGNIVVTITAKQPALPLSKGTYDDTLRVTVIPSQ